MVTYMSLVLSHLRALIAIGHLAPLHNVTTHGLPSFEYPTLDPSLRDECRLMPTSPLLGANEAEELMDVLVLQTRAIAQKH